MTTTPDIQRQYDELEAAIMRKVYPDAVYDEQYGEWAMPNGNGGFFVKRLGLEEVFIAFSLRGRGILEINERGTLRYSVYSGGSFMMPTTRETDYFFGKPVRNQSIHCIEFLHSLLVP